MTITAAELAWMRTAQTSHMNDTAYLQVYSEAANTFGEMVPTYTESATATTCGLDMRPGSERHDPEKTVLEYDATMRLPITAAPNPRDRYRVTARFGEALATPLVFEVQSPIQRGPSGIRVLLRKVEV